MSQRPTASGDSLGDRRVGSDPSKTVPVHPAEAPSTGAQSKEPPLVDEAVADLVDTLFSPNEEGAEEEDVENDELAYESGFGRMVDLGPDSEAGKRPPDDEDFELPADLLESGAFTAVPAQEQPEAESLELITDPRKKPADSGSSQGMPRSADFQTGAFKPLSGGTRTIEVPVTLDADLLEEGQSVRIILNLKLSR